MALTIAELNGIISTPLATLSGTLIVAMGTLLLKHVVDEPSISYSFAAFWHRLLRFFPGLCLLGFGSYVVYLSVIR
jgi:hypothetical protein